MTEQMLRWLEEAEEVSSPLPEMGVVPFSVEEAEEAERQEALVWAEAHQDYLLWRERQDGW